MSRNRHDDSRAVVRVHKSGGQDENLGASKRICDGPADQLFSGYLRSQGHLPVGKGQLLVRLFGDDPGLVVYFGLNIGHIRVEPEVDHSIDRLRPQGGAGQDHITSCITGRIMHPELDQSEVHDGGILAFEDVMVFDWIPVMRTPAHRMAALDYVIQPSQYAILPLDELAVSRIGGGELPPPVDGVADALHGRLGLAAEVEHYLFRRVKKAQLILRNAVQLCVNIPDEGVLVGDEFGETDNRRPCGVKSHGKENIVAAHATVASHGITDSERARVTGMQISIEIRVRYG